jgi:hypothetical protein
MLLQYFQDRLHGAPSSAPHVDDHREALLTHFIAARRKQIAQKQVTRLPFIECSIHYL